MRFPFQSHTALLSFIPLSIPWPHSFLSMLRFIQLCSPLLHRPSVTGGCHSPIGIHFIFSLALFTKQTRVFSISAMEILRPPFLLPKMELSVALQKKSHILLQPKLNSYMLNIYDLLSCYHALKRLMMLPLEMNRHMGNNFKTAKHSNVSIIIRCKLSHREFNWPAVSWMVRQPSSFQPQSIKTVTPCSATAL